MQQLYFKLDTSGLYQKYAHDHLMSQANINYTMEETALTLQIFITSAINIKSSDFSFLACFNPIY